MNSNRHSPVANELGGDAKMTRDTTSFRYSIYIASTPAKVFEAVTRPEIARQYWGHENVSDWQPGSKWEHVRSDSQRNVAIAGNVLENQPAKRLVFTWASAAEYSHAAAHSCVTLEIEPYAHMVRLAVLHDDLEKGSGMEKGISKGWPIVLSSLKSFLETGRALDVFANPLAA
jgi:uncharacterized protein YndB with AHSA1/START domain